MRYFLVLITFLYSFQSFAQEIHGPISRAQGFSGWKLIQDGEVLSKDEIKVKLMEADAYELWRKGKNQHNVGGILYGVGFGVFILGFASWTTNYQGSGYPSEYQEVTLLLMGTGAAALIAGLIPYYQGNVKMERAISKYNQKNLKSNANLGYGLGRNGIGITLCF